MKPIAEKWRPLAETLVRKLRRDYVGVSASAESLVDYLELSNDRDLRSVVRYARLVLGEPVLSTYDEGYSWPTGWDDDAYDHCTKQRREVAADNFAVAAAIARGMERYFGEPTLFEVV